MADLSCQELVELVSDYLEGNLDRRTRRRFEKHLAACAACPEYVAQIRATVSLLRHVSAPTLDERAVATVLAALRERRGRRGP